MVVILYAWIAVFFDVKFYRIPNILCFFIAVTGVFFSYIKYGSDEIDQMIIGIIVPIAVLYLFFYCGVMGAGDVKELSALGTFYGSRIWKIIVVSFLFNGLLSVWKMRQNASFTMRFYYLKGYLRDCRLEGRILRDYESRKEDRIHFSIGILCAVVCEALLSHRLI